MADDWIKMRTDLYRDPKVCAMSDSLIDDESELSRYVNQNCQRNMTVTRNVTRNAVVGALVTVWGVMRHRGKRVGTDLVYHNAKSYVVDDISEIPGFGVAMEDVGWLVETEDSLIFPRFFEVYNSEPAGKTAISSAERQRQYRERKKAETVTKSGVTRDVTVTRNGDDREREEKRREEVIKDTHTPREADDLPGNEEPGHRKTATQANATEQGQGEAEGPRLVSPDHSTPKNAPETILDANSDLSEIPTEREWMDACAMGGVPDAFAAEMWLKYAGDRKWWTRRGWRHNVPMVKKWFEEDRDLKGERNHDGTKKSNGTPRPGQGQPQYRPNGAPDPNRHFPNWREDAARLAKRRREKGQIIGGPSLGKKSAEN